MRKAIYMYAAAVAGEDIEYLHQQGFDHCVVVEPGIDLDVVINASPAGETWVGTTSHDVAGVAYMNPRCTGVAMPDSRSGEWFFYKKPAPFRFIDWLRRAIVPAAVILAVTLAYIASQADWPDPPQHTPTAQPQKMRF